MGRNCRKVIHRIITCDACYGTNRRKLIYGEILLIGKQRIKKYEFTGMITFLLLSSGKRKSSSFGAQSKSL